MTSFLVIAEVGFQVQEVHNSSLGKVSNAVYQRDEIKRMRDSIADLRNKLTQMDARVPVLSTFFLCTIEWSSERMTKS